MVQRNRPALTRESIVTAALALVDRVGLDEFTTRRLAAELEVKSPALYWHFSNKQELLDAMGDSIILAAGMGAPRRNETWQQWVSRRAQAYRNEMLRHRDGARIVSAVRIASPETVRLFAEEVTAMTALGFSAPLALQTIAVVTHYVTGFVLKEQAAIEARQHGSADDANPAEILSGKQLETLMYAMEAAGDPLGDDVFEHGLRMIVAGTESLLAERS